VIPGNAGGQGLHVIKNWVISVIPAKFYPSYVPVVVSGQPSSERQSLVGRKAIFQRYNWNPLAKGVNLDRKS
jgi:hypothetical protein